MAKIPARTAWADGHRLGAVKDRELPYHKVFNLGLDNRINDN